jgi:hypothetical protein
VEPSAGSAAEEPSRSFVRVLTATFADSAWRRRRKTLVACLLGLAVAVVLATVGPSLVGAPHKSHQGEAKDSTSPDANPTTPTDSHPTSAAPPSSPATPAPSNPSYNNPGSGPIRYTLSYEDPGSELVLHAEVTLTDRQRQGLVNFVTMDQPGVMDPFTLYAELRAEGAADPRYMYLGTTLEGRTRQTIHIDEIKPVNVKRTKPLDGTFIFIPSQGGGPISKMAFDFDDTIPRARDAVPDGNYHKAGGLYFANHSLTIAPGEEVDFLLTSMTTRTAVSFDIAIDYRLNGRAGHLLIDDHGHPFNLTPANCTRHSLSTPDGLVSDGQAAYHSVWEWDDFNNPVRQVADPAHYKLGYPEC